MRPRRPLLSGRAAALAIALVGAGAVALVGGCTNEPFDPSSLPNARPVARVFVSPVEGDTLNPTSYYHRTFYWSGSDADGRVVEFYVSIANQRGVPAPWDSTTATDTTMTFTTDDHGHAEATLRVACRDDRGALSDTVTQFVPLRNFPPVINYQADFDSLAWTYGAANLRFFALDLDGNETMEGEYEYWLDTADTNIVRAWNPADPAADPALCKVRKPFDDPDARTFAVELKHIPSAPRRELTISVRDEADADARFRCAWEVKEARGRVLVVADSGPFSNTYYFAVLDSLLGARPSDPEWPHAWSIWDMTDGLPDRPWVFRETCRQFDVVLWYTGGGASLNLRGAVGALTNYLSPETEVPAPTPLPPAGRLLVICKTVTGSNTNLPPGFITNVLGVSSTAAPPAEFNVPVGKRALGQRGSLPAFASSDGANRQALGLTTRPGTEALYKLETFQYQPRPPYDPIVVTRKPPLAQSPLASVIVMPLQLEYFDRIQVTAALGALLSQDLGVSLP